jgi:death-on-curing protein
VTPRWVPKSAVLAIHERLLAEHGGSPGILNEGGLDAALASPQNHLAHGNPDLFDLAAQYASALTRNHPFQDGNKRVAFTVAGVFLELNGFRLDAPEQEAVSAMIALSSRAFGESVFAAWLRKNSSRHPAQKKPRAGGMTSRRRRPRPSKRPGRRGR